MSSLEERREARRRKRLEEEAATVNGGDDDLERRRRERREARLRGGGDSAPAEDTSSRRSRRNRGGDDDDAPAEETTSVRSRRRRGGDEEETSAPAPEPEEKAEEEPAPAPAPAAEEDDSAAREAEAAERRRRAEEEEEERRRQQEEMRKQQQEEQRRREEERRKAEEEERKRKMSKEMVETEAVVTSFTSSPDSGHPSLYSPCPPGGPGPRGYPHPHPHHPHHSAQASVLSDGVFSFTSDDTLHDLTTDHPQRMMDSSSDYDLGSSFDDFLLSDQDLDSKSPLTIRPESRKRRSRVGGKSPHHDHSKVKAEGKPFSVHNSVPAAPERFSPVVGNSVVPSPTRVLQKRAGEDSETLCEHSGDMSPRKSKKLENASPFEGSAENFKQEEEESGCKQNERELYRTVNDESLPASSVVSDNESVTSEEESRSFPAHHQRSESSPDDVGRLHRPGHERSASSPSASSPSASAMGIQQTVSSRRSELQKQLQGRKEDPHPPSLRKMHSQGDLSPSARTGSQISEIISQLSSRLKKRDGRRERPQHQQFSMYRCQSEPLVASMPGQKLAESPRVSSRRQETPQAGRRMTLPSQGEEEEEVSRTVVGTLSGEDEAGCSRLTSQHEPDLHPPPLHVVPPASTTTTTTTTLMSDLIPSTPDHLHQFGHSSQNGPEELRLCLDFLHEPAEGTEDTEAGIGGARDLAEHSQGGDVSGNGEHHREPSDSIYSCDIPPPPEYCDDVVADMLGGPGVGSRQIVNPAFVENSDRVQSLGRAGQVVEAVGLSQVMDEEKTPFMTSLLKSVMMAEQREVSRSPSPPLPPPPPDCSFPSVSPPPPLSFPFSALADTPRMTPPPPLPPDSPPPPPVTSQELAESHVPRRLLVSSCPTPPPPPPPPSCEPPTQEPPVVEPPVVGKVSVSDTAPGGRGPRTEGTDLHSLLCEEIVQVGGRRAKVDFQSDLSSLESYTSFTENANENMGQDHLIRPSALKDGGNVRDWGGGIAASTPRSQVCVSARFSHEIQHASLRQKRKSFPTDDSQQQDRELRHEGMSRDLAGIRREGSQDKIVNKQENSHSMEWFQEEDEASKIEERLRLWKESRSSKLKPLMKSKSAVEFRTSDRAASEGHSWTASAERPQSCRVYWDAETRSDERSSVSDTSQQEAIPQSPCVESKPVMEQVKRKIPPPTLPKSSSIAHLQHSRVVIPEDSPTGQVFRQFSHNRFSSTSSVESEVFTSSRHQSTSDVQNGGGREAERLHSSSGHGRYPQPTLSASGPEKRYSSPRVVQANGLDRSSQSLRGNDRRYSSVDSAVESVHTQNCSSQRLERRHSMLDSSRREEVRYSTLESSQRSFERRGEPKKSAFESTQGSYQRYPSTESSRFNGVRHSLTDSTPGVRRNHSFAGTTRNAERNPSTESAPAVPGRYSSFESNRRGERRYSSIDSARNSETNSLPDREAGRRHSSTESAHRVENTTVRDHTLPNDRFQLGHKGNRSTDDDMMEAVRQRISLLNRQEQEHVESQSAQSTIQKTEERVETAPNPKDCGLRKKQGVPRPRFDARRLTQDSDIPTMWKCSEDAMTEYKPPPDLDYNSIQPLPGFLKERETTRSCDTTEGEDGKSEYSSWATEFVRDRILPSETPCGSKSERGRFTPDSVMESDALSVDSDGPRNCVSARASPSTQAKLMSITDRIGLLHKTKESKPAPSSVADLKAGFMSDRSGPGQKPVIKSQTAGTTPEQKRFASLLQNKLINIIAEDDAEAHREKQREKERSRRSPAVKKKLTPAQEIARSRAFALGSRKPVKADLPQWNPDAASKPSATSRDVYESIKMSQEKSGSVKDLAKEFTQLSDVVNEEEQEKRRQNVRRRRSRRLTTGLSVKDMKDMFDQSDSNPSSANSTRANTPRPVPPSSERIVDRFDTPAIAENRPLTNKGMIRINGYGSHSSVSDIVHKVETCAKDTESPVPRKSARSERSLAGSPSVKPSLARTGALTAEDQAPAAVRKPRMDKSRRFTTGVNFEELQLRFTQPDHYRKHNQSRAMSAIYASSQDISRRCEVEPRSSARSMENLSLADIPAGNLRILPPKRWEASSESMADLSRDPPLWDKRKPRSCSGVEESPYLSAPDIQSASGSAFSRVLSMRSPIKVAESVASSRQPGGLGERRSSLAERHCLEALEEEERLEAERIERERKEQEEEERRKEEEEKKKKKKRKGLGGLSPEKKKLLKKLIMQKAAEDLRNEAKAKAEEKEKYINERVTPLKTDGLGQAELQSLVKELHSKVAVLEEEVYDWEIKIRKQDFEINELTLKVNDTKGKFIKPVLRKVNKTESKLTKLQTKESRDFRGNLKSTGQNKFALKEEDETSKQPEWRKDLKKEGEGEGTGEEVPAES